MTATLDDVATRKNGKPEPTAEQKLAEELVARAREQGVSLTGPAHRPALDPPPATTRLRTGNPAGHWRTQEQARTSRPNAKPRAVGSCCSPATWTGAGMSFRKRASSNFLPDI
jgi:hypothetical protein